MLLRKLIKSLSVFALLALCIVIFIAYGGKWRDQVTTFIAGIYNWNDQAVTDKLPELRVGYIPIADAAQLYVAQDMDLFRKHGITVKPIAFAGGAKIIQALAVGELDVGFTGTVPFSSGKFTRPSNKSHYWWLCSKRKKSLPSFGSTN